MILDLFIYIIQFYINQNTFLPGFIIRKRACLNQALLLIIPKIFWINTFFNQLIAYHFLQRRGGKKDAADTVGRGNFIAIKRRELLKDEAVKKRFAELGFVTTGSTPGAFLERVRIETERWTKVVRENGIKVEG